MRMALRTHHTPACAGAPRTASAASRPARAGLALALSCALALAPLAGPLGATAALADETSVLGSSPVTDAVPDELQQRVEQTAAAYDDAVAAREQVEQQIADTQAHVDELNAALPGLRDSAADAIKTTYKYQQEGVGLVDLILSADDFSDFITTIQYLTAVQESNTSQISSLLSALSELETAQADLNAQKQQALEQEQAAQQAYEDAEAARAEAQRKAEEEAARQAAAAQAALAAQQAQAAADAEAARQAASAAGAAQGEAQAPAADSGATQAPVPDTPVISDDTTSAPSTDSSGSAGSGSGATDERSAYVASWGARIDAYLAGSPMAGQGATFAAAAWDYGVDPRWSPAIALVESSLGAYCFLPYNAWGWGNSSWGSWEEAIYAHVAGLARGYGYTLTYDAAQRYCPPNADYWYSAVLGQMESI